MGEGSAEYGFEIIFQNCNTAGWSKNLGGIFTAKNSVLVTRVSRVGDGEDIEADVGCEGSGRAPWKGIVGGVEAVDGVRKKVGVGGGGGVIWHE